MADRPTARLSVQDSGNDLLRTTFKAAYFTRKRDFREGEPLRLLQGSLQQLGYPYDVQISEILVKSGGNSDADGTAMVVQHEEQHLVEKKGILVEDSSVALSLRIHFLIRSL